jgi:hypothetical protein
VAETDGALFGPGMLDPLTADIRLVVHDQGVLARADRRWGSQLRALQRVHRRAVLGA